MLLWALLMPPSIAQIDHLASTRDVAGLTALLTSPPGPRNPLAVIKTGGAYDVGRFGWHAYALGPEYVVLSTPLTSEDVGEILLRREGSGLTVVPEQSDMGVRIFRHSLDVRLDVPKKRAEVVDKLRLGSLGTGAYVFRMSPAYRVSEITNGQGAKVPFTQAGGIVLLKDRSANLTVRYGGVVNLPQYAGSITDKEATLVNDYWYPMIARHPAPYDITVHAPKNWTVVGQGTRLSDTTTATERIAKFKMDLPVVYYSVSAGPYKTVQTQVNGRTYTVWSPRLGEDRMRAQAESYAAIVEFYSKSFGNSPFNGFGALDSPQYGGGALEAYSYATYGGLWGEDAHEPAHTWWGGMIDNTYLNSFWNESFAVFSDGLFHREAPIGDLDEKRQAFAAEGGMGDDYDQVAVQYAGANEGPIASSMGYGKGSKVLAMLEQLIGTRQIVADMHEWIATQPKGQPGDWPDFEKIVAKNSPDKDVKGFCDDWLRRPGYADFDASASWENGQVTLNLTWKGPRFRMPLNVLLQTGSNRTYKTVWLDGTANPVTIAAAAKPDLVSIDPWRQAVRPIGNDEDPASAEAVLRRLPKFVDPAHKDWLPGVGGRQTAPDLNDIAGKFIVGSPETLPAMKPLCDQVGFVVSGNRLTYRGTTIDLTKGAAIAIVDLGQGKQCVIGLGKTRMTPNAGRAQVALVDDLGHFLRGQTEPKTTGKLTFRL